MSRGTAGRTAPAARRFGSDPIVFLLVATALVSALFLAWPGIDLAVSRLFHEPGAGFTLSGNPFLAALRVSGQLVMIAIIAAVLASLAVKLARPDRPSLIPPGASLFLVSTLALGPGVLVNLVLKNNWGRPRPVMTDPFGGEMPFIGIWRITDHCATNCSFVSGEASSAIWLTGLALVVPPRWRLATAIVTGVYAVLLSLNRIAFGGHFASDVVLAWTLTLMVMAVAHRFILERPPAFLANDTLEAGLARLGQRLRHLR